MGYIVWNHTDGLMLSPFPHDTKEEAEKYLELYKRMVDDHQGYWKTGDGRRIPVDDVTFEIIEDEDEVDDDELGW